MTPAMVITTKEIVHYTSLQVYYEKKKLQTYYASSSKI